MSRVHFFHFQNFKMKPGVNIAIGLLAAGVGVYLFTRGTGQGGQTRDGQQQAIINVLMQGNDSEETKQGLAALFDQMTDAEIQTVYTFLFEYVAKGTRPPEGSTLANQVQAISEKYNIFT